MLSYLITMYSFFDNTNRIPLTPCVACPTVSFHSTAGLSEEAVCVYNSTPLQELSDLAGLALAYSRAGLIPESINGLD